MEKNLKPIGALFGDSWHLYRKHMNVFALISVIPFLFTGVKMALAPYLYNVWGMPVDFASASLVAVFGLLYLVFAIVLPFAMNLAIHETEQGKIPEVNDVYKKAFSSVIPYLCVVILAGIVVLGGSVLFIIPGIIAAVYLSLAQYVYIFEGKKGIDALVTSAWYVRNFWWDILARKIILAIFVIIATVVFSAIIGPLVYFLGFSVAVFQFLFSLFVFMFVVPFALTVSYRIYKDVKHAQEARGRTGTPEKAFLVEAEKIYVILIIVAAVAAVGLFLLVNLHPPMHYGYGMHYYQYQYHQSRY